MNRFFAFAGMALLFSSAWALPLETPLPDATQEANARAIFHALRCVVCQGESIADSHAEVASDMRREIRVLVAEGKPYDEIIAYFTTRYGDFVLLRPPFNRGTALLWFLPLMIVVAGGVAVGFYFCRSPMRKDGGV